jgi:hypothetical protein
MSILVGRTTKTWSAANAIGHWGMTTCDEATRASAPWTFPRARATIAAGKTA